MKSINCFIAAVICGCAFLIGCQEGEDARTGTVASGEVADAAPNEGNRPSDSLRYEMQKPDVEDFLCQQSCGQNRWRLARTPEEAKWLMRNGFPSQNEVDLFESMSAYQLGRLAAGGSIVAQAEYGRRLAASGELANGLLELKKASDRGSIYAYYLISEVQLRNANDRLSAGAFLRVAYLLGDTRAGDMMTGLDLHVVESRVVDQRAAALLQTFAGGQQPDHRPIQM